MKQTKKTLEEIASLKHNWRCDPCWDIHTTEGFEAHVEELKEFQSQCEKEWKENEIKNLQEFNKKYLGLPNTYYGQTVMLITFLHDMDYKMKKMQEEIDSLKETKSK